MSEFTLESWKNKIGENLEGVKERINSTAAGSVYALLAGSALLPVYQIMLTDPSAAHALLRNLGVNLVANVIQKWKDKTDPLAASEAVTATMLADPKLLQQLDLILEKLNVIEQARDILPPVDQQSFRNILREELEKLGNAQYPYFQAVLTSEDHAAEHRYLRALSRRCLDLPLSALGHDRAVADRLRLDRVYIGLDTTTNGALSEKNRVERKNTQQMGQEETRPLSALEVAQANPHLVLLGDPGGGKTTFVRRLAAWLATARLGEGPAPEGWGEPELPLLIGLRDLAPSLAGLDLHKLGGEEQRRLLASTVRARFVAELADFGVENFTSSLEEELDKGSALLIFDGLDEVAEQLRPLVLEALIALIDLSSPHHRMLVTCRRRAYTDTTRLKGISEYTLAPFDEEKIKGFIAAWYGAQEETLGKEKTDERRDDLEDAALSEELREMSQNPMLLTTMAVIHQKNVGLPSQRVKLYSQAVTLLAVRWEKERLGGFDDDKLGQLLSDEKSVRQLLENIAYAIHATQAAGRSTGPVDRFELLKSLEQQTGVQDLNLHQRFLDYVDQRAGLLEGRREQGGTGRVASYAFVHRTFQEYLAGCRMIR
ncbi:MAG: hypothetical protein OEM02_10365, partial [Desulfobulbaceae bacterium]|nr:hypothetical protein [Desulfobulbaceae bacterium]